MGTTNLHCSGVMLRQAATVLATCFMPSLVGCTQRRHCLPSSNLHTWSQAASCSTSRREAGHWADAITRGVVARQGVTSCDRAKQSASDSGAIIQQLLKVQQRLNHAAVEAVAADTTLDDAHASQRTRYGLTEHQQRQLQEKMQIINVALESSIMRKHWPPVAQYQFAVHVKAERLRQQLAAFIAEFHDKKTLAGWIQRAPHTLNMRPATVQQKLITLQSLLGTTKFDTVKVVNKNPQLLCRSSKALKQNIRHVQDFAGWNEKQLKHVLTRDPMLLNLASETVSNKHQFLLQLLRVQQQVLVQPLSRMPELLRFSIHTLEAHFKGMLTVTNKSEAAVSEMVLAQPSLLQVTTSTLNHKHKMLHIVAARHTEWQQQIQSWSNKQLAFGLTRSSMVLARGVYLLEINHEVLKRQQTLHCIISRSEADWLKLVGTGFADWWQRQHSNFESGCYG